MTFTNNCKFLLVEILCLQQACGVTLKLYATSNKMISYSNILYL